MIQKPQINLIPTVILILSFLCSLEEGFSQTSGTNGFWDLNGNSATAGTNFIGTLDSKAFRIKTNNAVRITVTSNGKVGVGNTSPVFKLDVKNGSINTDSTYRIKGIRALSSGAANIFQLGDAGSFIGIGTAAPSKALDVFSSGDVGAYIHSATGNAIATVERTDSNAVSQVEFRNAGGGLGAQTWRMGIGRGANDFTLGASTFSGNAITVLRSNGNVGIGTGNPQARLEVSGQVKCTGGMEVIGTLKVAGGAGGQVLTYEAATGNAIWQTPTGGISGTGVSGRVSFWNGTTSLSSNTNLFWDNVNNRLGIGTSSPSATLDINGQLRITGGSPGSGKVLVSDPNGIASWQTPSSGGFTGTGLANHMVFWNSATSLNYTTNLFWDSGNNRLGVGNPAPSVPFHVNGGTDAALGSGGFIVCGPLSTTNLVIDQNEIMARDNSLPSTLTLQNNGGNLVIDGTFTGTLVGIGVNSPSYQLQLAANSAGKPLSSAWTVTSDARLKKDISDFKDGLSLIQKLNPIWFSYTGEAGMPVNERGVGTLAQELKKIAPYMVKEWTYQTPNGEKKQYLAVDYGAMDFVLANAIKEQQLQLENKDAQLLKQQNELDELKGKFAVMETALTKCCSSYEKSGQKDKSGLNSEERAYLEQNIPNPFTENTIIRFYLPQTTKKAFIKVYALDGTELKSLPLAGRGYSEITLTGRTLTAGTYTYILLVDGAVADMHQMILSR